jgi:hypothetical protein
MCSVADDLITELIGILNREDVVRAREWREKHLVNSWTMDQRP